MQHALRVNQQRGISTGGTAPMPAAQQQQPAGLAAGGDAAAIQAAAPPAVGNSLLAQLHAERMARQSQQQQAQAQAQAQRPASSDIQPAPQQQGQGQGQGPGLQQGPAQLSLLSYNVWFADVCIQSRMAAIGSVIQERQPDFVCLQVSKAGPPPLPSSWRHLCQQTCALHALCHASSCLAAWLPAAGSSPSRPATALSAAPSHTCRLLCVQEVTPLIAQLFRGSPWWQAYNASPCPAGAPYFTMLLWKKSSVQGPSGYAELPFENSIMGGWVAGWMDGSAAEVLGSCRACLPACSCR